jgi:thiamine pyridinylase
MRIASIAGGILACTISAASLSSVATAQGKTPHRTLRVALYPFVPAKADYFLQVKHDFEAIAPNVDLQLIDLSANYYDPGDQDFALTNSVDVYELDSVLLADAVAKDLIMPLPKEINFRAQDYLANAQTASQWDGKPYGVPHWVCGYFLFFRGDDAQADTIRGAKTLAQLERIIGNNHPPRTGMLVDLRGRLSLGEMYLAAAFDKYKSWPDVQSHLGLHPEASLESDLCRVLQLCDKGLGRNKQYHKANGFYGRQFARGGGRVLIGYSEGLFAVLDESQNACLQNECLTDRMIDVTELPLDDGGSSQISWVDLLAINKNCTGETLADAIGFISFMDSEETMLKVLLPDPDAARPARYLLPARLSLYSNQHLVTNSVLYPKLRAIIERSFPPVRPNLNNTLRSFGPEIDTFLNTCPTPPTVNLPPPSQPPSVPTNVSAQRKNQIIQVTWNGTTVDYDFQQSWSDHGVWRDETPDKLRPATAVPNTGDYGRDANALPQPMRFRVRAVNGDQTSDWSPWAPAN